ncbi:MAG: hypothetical protein DMF89_17540 [Acidobacteria bacterium]|nr:MAG: hypothetical protein DMF89_17540 [Acidobacteriota bacterium]
MTVRAQVVDTHLLAGLRAALLRPETVRYITGEFTRALNRLIDDGHGGRRRSGPHESRPPNGFRGS